MDTVTKSESIKNLAAALSKAQKEISNVVKDSENPHFRSTFASLPAVVAEINKVLPKYDLSLVQVGTILPDGRQALTTILIHSSGEFLQGSFALNPVRNDPQSMCGAITFFRRYAAQAMVNIGSEDDDGNAASAKPAPMQQQDDSSQIIAKMRAESAITPKQVALLFARARESGWDEKSVRDMIGARMDCQVEKIPTPDFQDILGYFETTNFEKKGKNHLKEILGGGV